MKQWQSWVIMLKGQCNYPGSALSSLWGKEGNRKTGSLYSDSCILSARNFLCAWTLFKVSKGLGLRSPLCNVEILNLLLNELTWVIEAVQLRWHGAIFRLAALLHAMCRSILSRGIASSRETSETVGKVIIFFWVLLQQSKIFAMLLLNYRNHHQDMYLEIRDV